MKLGTKIKVVASQPNDNQESISYLLGKVFSVVSHWKQKDSPLDTGEIQIKHDGSLYVLNKCEYEVVD